MEERMTVKDILQNTVNDLNGIMLPVGLMDTAGQTIKVCANNLQACVNAIRQEEWKQEKLAKRQEETDEAEDRAEEAEETAEE